jgi:hypothetical protein
MFGATPSVRLTASHHFPAQPKIPLSPLFTATSKTSQKCPPRDSLTPLFSSRLFHLSRIFLTLKQISPLFSTNSEKHGGRGVARYSPTIKGSRNVATLGCVLSNITKSFHNSPARPEHGRVTIHQSLLVSPLSSALTEKGEGVGNTQQRLEHGSDFRNRERQAACSACLGSAGESRRANGLHRVSKGQLGSSLLAARCSPLANVPPAFGKLITDHYLLTTASLQKVQDRRQIQDPAGGLQLGLIGNLRLRQVGCRDRRIYSHQRIFLNTQIDFVVTQEILAGSLGHLLRSSFNVSRPLIPGNSMSSVTISGRSSATRFSAVSPSAAIPTISISGSDVSASRKTRRITAESSTIIIRVAVIRFCLRHRLRPARRCRSTSTPAQALSESSHRSDGHVLRFGECNFNANAREVCFQTSMIVGSIRWNDRLPV